MVVYFVWLENKEDQPMRLPTSSNTLLCLCPDVYFCHCQLFFTQGLQLIPAEVQKPKKGNLICFNGVFAFGLQVESRSSRCVPGLQGRSR